MLKLFRALAISLAAAAISAAPAAAQSTAQQSSEFQSWEMPGWTVTPGIVVGELYDSNVALAAPASGTTKTASDRLFEVEPYGQIEYIDPRTNFFSGYRGDFYRYSTLNALDDVNHTAYVSLRRFLTRRVTVSASDYFMRAPTTDQLQLNGVPFLRRGSQYDDLTGTLDAQLSRRTELSTRYDLTWAKFQRSDTLLSGGTVNGIRTDLLRLVTDRVGIGGEYTVRWSDLNVNTRLLAFQEFGGVVRYHAAPTITLEIAAGIGHLADFVQQLSRTGPYVRGDLTDHLRRATVGLHYERRYTPTLGFGGSNQSQEASGSIQMPLIRRGLYVESTVLWRQTNPIFPGVLPLNAFWLRATGGYALQRWVRIEVYDSYAREDTRETPQPIFRTIAGVQVVLSQPMRIR